MKFNRIRFLQVAMIAILLLAAYLRLNQIEDYMTFLGDEGRDVLRVKRMLVDGDLILLGPTASVGGFFLGPMYYYFMTPFLWLWQYNPVGPAIMVALFGIATVYLVYVVGSKWFHPIVGLSASLLYALSPVVIAYSRSSWNPNLVPFFGLLLMYCLWRMKLYKQTRDYFISGIIWGLGIQFHYLFLFLIVMSWIWMIAFVRPTGWIKKFGVALLGALISYSPFIVFELKHNFPNTRSIINFLMAGQETGFSSSTFSGTITDVLLRSFGRLLYRLPDSHLWITFPDWQIPFTFSLIKTTILIGVLSLLLMIFSQKRRIQSLFKKYIKTTIVFSPEQRTASLLMLVWLGCCITFFGFYRRGIYDYYFGIYYAVPFLFVGIIVWILSKTSKAGAIIAGILLCGLAYYNWQGRPFVYPPNKQMAQTRTIAQEALALTDNQPFNFALLTDSNSDHGFRYFFEIASSAPITIENTVIDPDRNTVTEQLIVICDRPVCQPLGDSLWEIAGFGRAEIVAEKDVFPVKIFKLVPFVE